MKCFARQAVSTMNFGPSLMWGEGGGKMMESLVERRERGAIRLVSLEPEATLLLF